jgi:hypothetical protein
VDGLVVYCRRMEYHRCFGMLYVNTGSRRQCADVCRMEVVPNVLRHVLAAAPVSRSV